MDHVHRIDVQGKVAILSVLCIPYADEAGTVARDDHASARVERIQHVAQPVKSKLDSLTPLSRHGRP
jgi:hypothetical protein